MEMHIDESRILSIKILIRCAMWTISRHALSMAIATLALLTAMAAKPTSAGITDDPVERWLGSMWIPSDGKLHSKAEIRAALQGKRVLFLGDSLGRRLGATLAAILASADTDDLGAQVLDNHDLLSLGMHSEHVYKNGLPEGDLIAFQWAPMLRDLRLAAQEMEKELSRSAATVTTAPTDRIMYTDVVVAVGLHDAMMPFASSDVQADIQASMALFGQMTLKWGLRVIWRTSPYRWDTNIGPVWIYQEKEGDDTSHCPPGDKYHDDANRCHAMQEPQYSREVNTRLESINNWIRRAWVTYQDTRIGPTLGDMRLVEFAQEVAPRSIGKARLAGDSPEHFSSLARMVCIQMLVRTWIEIADDANETQVRALDSEKAQGFETQQVEGIEGGEGITKPSPTAEEHRVLGLLLRGQ